MKRIGLIGGMDPQRLIHYYKGLNDRIEKDSQGLEKLNALILTLDYKKNHSLIKNKNTGGLIKELIYACEGLKANGYQTIAFTDDIYDRYGPKIKDNLAVKILSKEAFLGRKMVDSHLSEVLLIRENEKTLDPYYISAYLRYGVNIHEPSLKIQQEIIKYQKQVNNGDLSIDELLLKVVGIIESYALKGIHGVLLEGLWLEGLIESKDISIELLKGISFHMDYIFNVLKKGEG